MTSWIESQRELATLTERQLFFVGGAPRSGTTWLQLLLDTHPEVSCGGEGLFARTLAEPLKRLIDECRAALEQKNQRLFGFTGGYKLPGADDVEVLLGTAVLRALRRQSGDRSVRAIGEKTPENVFLFPRLKRLFPGAKLIVIMRDPRDVLTSAWHTFVDGAEKLDAPTKTNYVRSALPALNQGARAALALQQQDASSCLIITYEELHASTAAVAARLFGFLGVSDEAAIVEECVARTDFKAVSGGRAPGTAHNGAFFRKGVIGDWRSTLTPDMNALITQELGWMYPLFRWQL